MIIYGTRPVDLKQKQVESENTCPNCGNEGTLFLSVYSVHIHIFWIPIFPIFKRVVGICMECSHTIKPKHMEAHLKREANNFKKLTRKPLWQYTGLAIIALAIGYGTLQGRKRDAKELAFLHHPKVGDQYQYQTENGNYSIFRINHTSNDTLYIQENMFESTKFSGLFQINTEENYSQELTLFTLAEVDSLYHQKIIKRIIRN